MARITGNQGSMTGSAGPLLTFGAYGYFWSAQFKKMAYDVTPMPRVNAPEFVVSSLQYANGKCRFTVDDSLAAPLPSEAEVTITLKTKDAATARGYSFKAKLTDIAVVSQSPGGRPVEYEADWVRSDATDAAITVT